MSWVVRRTPLKWTNRLALLVTDSDDQTCEVETTVTVDVEGPVLVLTQPAGLQDVLTNEAMITVRGSVEDAHFSDNLDILMNNRAIEPEGGVQWVDNQFELSIPLESGWQTVTLIATDDLANEGEPIEFNVELDNVAPQSRFNNRSPSCDTPKTVPFVAKSRQRGTFAKRSIHVDHYRRIRPAGLS